MSSPVTIDFENKKEILRAFDRAPRLGEKVFSSVLDKTRIILDKHNQPNNPTPVDQGRLIGSFNFQSSENKATYGPTVDYAVYVHEGTEPHNVPFDEIAPWAQRKGLNPGKVQDKIEDEGTEPNPFLEKLMDKAEGDIVDQFNKGLDEFNKKLSKDLE
jgi:hypothetical protein